MGNLLCAVYSLLLDSGRWSSVVSMSDVAVALPE
jgi:hypothetical protein